MSFLENIVILIAINAVAATGLNFVVAYCGLSLAQAGYFAVGAYVYALAAIKLGWEFLPAALLAAAVAAALSPLISAPAWRLKGDAFVLATLCVQALLHALCYNWSSEGDPLGSLRNMTNGPYGVQGIPAPAVFGASPGGTRGVALFFGALAAAVVLLSACAHRSPWGRLLSAMRDDELLARALGKNTRLLKAQACAIACGAAGLAGACYASYVTYVSPDVGALESSVALLVAVLIGGTGNVAGPLLGAVLLGATPELLRLADIPSHQAPTWRLLIFGFLLLAVSHLRPRGLAGRYEMG